MTFDTALSRLTGLYLVLSVLLPFFLNIGMHFAIFQLEGKIPLSKELFIIQVNGRAINSLMLVGVTELKLGNQWEDEK